jgi:hypothetical protein
VAHANNNGHITGERSGIVGGSKQNPRGTEEQESVIESTRSDFFSALSANVADSDSTQCEGRGISSGIHSQYSDSFCPSWWDSEPNVGRVANGVAARVDRLKAIGNGQVPLVAATAWRLLNDPS